MLEVVSFTVDKEMAPRSRHLPGPGPQPLPAKEVTVDTNILRNTPEKVAVPDEKTPHACLEGFVYLGVEGEDENGEHVEVIERVPCRRCQRSYESL